MVTLQELAHPLVAQPLTSGDRIMAKRTVLRSSKGKKLYAVRTSDGQFKDIQSYAKAHAADLRSKSKAETAAGGKRKAKKKTAKKAGKKKAARKAAKKK